ncbi:MAG: hypothetical protein AB8C84_11520 [Oligoflexales bacterium]
MSKLFLYTATLCFLLHNSSYGNILSLKDIHKEEAILKEEIRFFQQEQSFSNSASFINLIQNEYSSQNIPHREFQHWFEYHNNLLKRYDQLNLSKQEWLTNRAWEHYQYFHQTLILNDKHDSILSEFTTWNREKGSFYGNNVEQAKKRTQRHWSFHVFFSSLDDFYEDHRKKHPNYYHLDKIDSSLGMFSTIKHKTCQVLHASYVAWHVFTLLPDVFFQPSGGFLGKPISQKIDSLFCHIKNMDGIKVHISQKKSQLPDFLPPSTKNVYLLLPIHQHALLDAYMMSSLDLPHHLIFSNPKIFSPTQGIAQLVANHPQFISVGVKTSDNLTAVEQVEFAIQEGHGNIVINYPQGHLEPNFIAPIHGLFGEKMIGHLVDKGYAVHITPLMWEVPSTFPRSTMNFANEFPQDEYIGHVLPTIPPRVTAFLREKMKEDQYKNIFDVLLRSAWLKEKKAYFDLSIDEMLRRIQEMENGTHERTPENFL